MGFKTKPLEIADKCRGLKVCTNTAPKGKGSRQLSKQFDWAQPGWDDQLPAAFFPLQCLGWWSGDRAAAEIQEMGNQLTSHEFWHFSAKSDSKCQLTLCWPRTSETKGDLSPGFDNSSGSQFKSKLVYDHSHHLRYFPVKCCPSAGDLLSMAWPPSTEPWLPQLAPELGYATPFC